jgi:hypothetical protein
MEQGSQLLEKSLVMTGEVVEADSVWQGGPASVVPVLLKKVGPAMLARTMSRRIDETLATQEWYPHDA